MVRYADIGAAATSIKRTRQRRIGLSRFEVRLFKAPDAVGPEGVKSEREDEVVVRVAPDAVRTRLRHDDIADIAPFGDARPVKR